MHNAKLINHTLLLLALLCFVFFALFALAPVRANAEINYGGEITITREDGQLKYGNNSELVAGDSLQSIIDAIAQNTPSNQAVRIVLDNLTVDEQITLTTGRQFVLNGSCIYTGLSSPFIAVPKDTTLTLSGINLTSQVTAISVSYGGRFFMSSGNISVYHENSYASNALVLNGYAEIHGGIVRYEAKRSSGAAVLQSDYRSELIIGGEEYIEISGNSAMMLFAGTTTINSGEIKATYPTYATAEQPGNTTSGFAVLSPSDAKLTVNGGVFSSVTAENTITLYGNSNSYLKFNGGNVIGNVNCSTSDNSPQIKIGDLTIRASLGGKVRLSADNVLQPTNAVLSCIPEEGYAFLYWNNSGDKNYYNPLVLNEDLSGDIAPVATTEYEVVFILGEEEKVCKLAYGTEIFLPDYMPPCPVGYQVDSWTRDGKTVSENTFVSGSNVFVATISLQKPQPVQIADVNVTYSPEGVLLKAEALHPFSQLEYKWYKIENGEAVFLSSEQILKLTKVTESGSYQFEAFVADNEVSSSGKSDPITVTIEKANYTDIQVPSFTGVYSPQQKLSSLALPEGFRWNNPEETPVVSKTVYGASFCLDEVNYNILAVEISITLEKSTIKDEDMVSHNTLSGVYHPEKTLSQYSLQKGYAWKNPDTVPTCDVSYYPAIYNPDKENYHDKEVSITLYLSKNHFEDVSDISYQCEYTEGLTLLDIEEKLPDGYHVNLKYPQFVQLTVGAQEHELYYNTDSVNYNNYTGITLFLEVKKGNVVSAPTYPQIEEFYFEGITLSQISLEEGWRWKEPDTAVTIGEKEYPAYYNPNVDLYNDCTTSITVVLYISEIDMSTITFEDLTVDYDGNPHSIKYQGELPEHVAFVEYVENHKTVAGVYQVECIFAPSTNGYKLSCDKFTATLTINKIYPIFSGEETQTFLYDGKVKSASIRLNNTQQTVISNPKNEFTLPGTYQIQFTAIEGANYYALNYDVTVIIKPIELVAEGVGGGKVSLTDSLNGFTSDVNLSVSFNYEKEKNQCDLQIEVENLSEWAGELLVKLPTSCEQFTVSKIVDAIGKPLVFSVNEDKTVVVTLDKIQNITFHFETFVEEEPSVKEEILPVWAWCLIAIGGAGLIAGAVVTILLLRRREK